MSSPTGRLGQQHWTMRDQRSMPQAWARREQRRQIVGIIIIAILLAAVAYGWHYVYGVVT
jgi:hypothetical protein